MKRWWLPILGAAFGVVLAYTLPEWESGAIDGAIAPRTYFLWFGTMSRGWSATFYALIGLGVGLVAALVMQLRQVKR
jgi:hypothetical protein